MKNDRINIDKLATIIVMHQYGIQKSSDEFPDLHHRAEGILNTLNRLGWAVIPKHPTGAMIGAVNDTHSDFAVDSMVNPTEALMVLACRTTEALVKVADVLTRK